MSVPLLVVIGLVVIVVILCFVILYESWKEGEGSRWHEMKEVHEVNQHNSKEGF